MKKPELIMIPLFFAVALYFIHRYSAIEAEVMLESDRRSRVLDLRRAVEFAHHYSSIRRGLDHGPPDLLQGWRLSLSAERKERARMLEAVVPPHQELSRAGHVLLIWEVPQARWKTDLYVAVPVPPGHPEASGAPELAMLGYTLRGQSYVRYGALLAVCDPSIFDRPVVNTVYAAPCRDEDHFRQMFFEAVAQSQAVQPYSPDPRVWTHVYVYGPKVGEWTVRRR